MEMKLRTAQIPDTQEPKTEQVSQLLLLLLDSASAKLPQGALPANLERSTVGGYFLVSLNSMITRKKEQRNN